jgi:hypothetical protein
MRKRNLTDDSDVEDEDEELPPPRPRQRRARLNNEWDKDADDEDEELPRRRRRLRAYDDDEDEDESPPSRRRRRLDEDDEDDEDEYFNEDPEEELLDTLEHLDHYRQQMDVHFVALQSLLRRYPDLQAKWQEFGCGGGITAEDFRKFLAGRFRNRRTRTRRHMRLISNRRPPAIRLRRRQNGDPPDEAA